MHEKNHTLEFHKVERKNDGKSSRAITAATASRCKIQLLVSESQADGQSTLVKSLFQGENSFKKVVATQASKCQAGLHITPLSQLSIKSHQKKKGKIE